MTRPTRVIRSSSRDFTIAPSSRTSTVALGVHRAELVELEELAAAPERSWRNSTGPRESSLIAIAIAISTGERASSARPAPSTSSVRLLTRDGRREGRRVDREQRHAADLLDRARAVEELEQPRDDVDGHAGVAADAQRVQQLLVVGAREGDHHAVDEVELDEVAERAQAAEAGQPRRCPGRRRRRR